MTETARTTAFYDAIDAFQRTHRLPGLQHAQIRGLLAEHLARVFPAEEQPARCVPAADRAALADRIRLAIAHAHYDSVGSDRNLDELEPEEFAGYAAAVLAVLPAPADRAAVYAEVADRLAADAEQGAKDGLTRIYRRSAAKQVREWGEDLRRVADETPQPANEEQGAPVDWQAIVRDRERELKKTGEARHRAEAALARVHALTIEHPAGIDTALIEAALDQPAPVSGPRP